MGFQFITNLRDQTVSSFERRGYTPPAWLLSSHRISKARLELARSFRESGALIFADNGTKKLIEDTANRFSASQEPLRDWIRQMRYDLPGAKRIPSPSEVPELLREQVSAAAHQVCDDVDRVLDAIGYESVLVEQLEMTPTHLVAREDYAVACLISLGLEREISGWPVSYFDRRNQKTLDFWRQIAADPRCDQIKVFATLSAVDYSTARSAARLGYSDMGVNRKRIENLRATLVGQGLAAPEMYELRSYLDDRLEEAEAKAGQAPVTVRESAQL